MFYKKLKTLFKKSGTIEIKLLGVNNVDDYAINPRDSVSVGIWSDSLSFDGVSAVASVASVPEIVLSSISSSSSSSGNS